MFYSGRSEQSEQVSYSCVNPMVHTDHTMTNHTRQPVATMARSIETWSAWLSWASARDICASRVIQKRGMGRVEDVWANRDLRRFAALIFLVNSSTTARVELTQVPLLESAIYNLLFTSSRVKAKGIHLASSKITARDV